MNEEDLIPFDWNAYCAGAEAYECLGDYGCEKVESVLSKVISRGGEVSFEDTESTDVYFTENNLKLLKPKQEDYVAFKSDPKDSLIMRGDK